ncbi:unnamed protein product [Pleuronectes platessa]|uniref:Uncharacterized protein n=1 Tax=Pleuronectes platessa TaxID=8262 RepID=A0A9N7UNY1_PLEPL|nr:unnamed protein product [Pleuronectes platessa]
MKGPRRGPATAGPLLSVLTAAWNHRVLESSQCFTHLTAALHHESSVSMLKCPQAKRVKPSFPLTARKLKLTGLSWDSQPSQAECCHQSNAAQPPNVGPGDRLHLESDTARLVAGSTPLLLSATFVLEVRTSGGAPIRGEAGGSDKTARAQWCVNRHREAFVVNRKRRRGDNAASSLPVSAPTEGFLANLHPRHRVICCSDKAAAGLWLDQQQGGRTSLEQENDSCIEMRRLPGGYFSRGSSRALPRDPTSMNCHLSRPPWQRRGLHEALITGAGSLSPADSDVPIGPSCGAKAFLCRLLHSVSSLLSPGSGVECLCEGSVSLSALTRSLLSSGHPHMPPPSAGFLNTPVNLSLEFPRRRLPRVPVPGRSPPLCPSPPAPASLEPGQSPGLHSGCQTQFCQWRVLKAGVVDTEEKAGVLLSHYSSVSLLNCSTAQTSSSRDLRASRSVELATRALLTVQGTLPGLFNTDLVCFCTV